MVLVLKEPFPSNPPLHYLDDFIFCGAPVTSHCEWLMECFQQVTSGLGVPLAEEKTEEPCTVLTFLVAELDTAQQSSRLPVDTMLSLQQQLQSMLQSARVTLRELQVLVGHLNFACKVVAPEQTFLRHLCDAMKGLSKPPHCRRLTGGMREDLKV